MKKKTQEKEEQQDSYTHKATDNKEHTKSKDSHTASAQEKPSSDSDSGKVTETDKGVNEARVAEEKLAEMQDRYIRLSAEFDNYRKRTLREKMELSKYAEENLLIKLLPFMDDFERALQHLDDDSDVTAHRDGINLIYNKFGEFLKQSGIREIESQDSSFNVDLHEAVARVPVKEDGKKGKVINVVLKGYYLQDKVLRFAKVVVGE